VIPFEANDIGLAADGTISVNGEPVARVGLVTIEDQTRVFREGGVLFRAEGGTAPLEGGRVLQGYLEQSNVNAVAEMSRMIMVQRAYEYGQKIMDGEDERIRLAMRTLGPKG
jgi:flagellar basal-body rod protein FlgF